MTLKQFMKSYDPRINRISLPSSEEKKEALEGHEHWETYEVFHQKKRGEQHVHVGIVHAPSPEIALVFAKEQYGRRRTTANLWVVKSSCVHASEYDDQDIFATTPEKTYREASDYYVMDKIRKFQKEHGIQDRKELKRK
jgi:ring-1,2-phenylacetyl-CoA epoxidase subunit PaaB